MMRPTSHDWGRRVQPFPFALGVRWRLATTEHLPVSVWVGGRSTGGRVRRREAIIEGTRRAAPAAAPHAAFGPPATATAARARSVAAGRAGPGRASRAAWHMARLAECSGVLERRPWWHGTVGWVTVC
jgi:hypothetical protein